MTKLTIFAFYDLYMKKLTLILLVFLMVSCKKDQVQQEYYYKAISGENVGLLKFTVVEKRFFGHYEVYYGKSGKDVGKIDGSIYGDTLKGKFKYLSFGGSNKIAPFLLLKRGKVLKLGTGAMTSYMNIPYFVPETVEFNDNEFQFYQIDKKSAEKLDLIAP